MALFFFDLHECGRVLIDEEGVNLPDLDTAYVNAVREARHILADEVKNGHLCLECHIKILGDERQVLKIVDFKDVIDFP